MVAETRLRNSLHYKNEKSLQFSTFLDKLQKMFNIFEEEHEAISEQAKVRLLLQKVEHPQLRDAVGALCVDQSRKIAAAESKVRPRHVRGGGAGSALASKRKKGIHMPDGSIWTGYYSDWDKMSESDKQTVMDTRKKNKSKGTTPNKKKAGDLSAQLAELKRSIAAIQSKTTTDVNDGDTDSSDVPDNFAAVSVIRRKRNDGCCPFPQLLLY